MELRLHEHCIDMDSQEKRYTSLVVESQIETLLPRLHVLHESAMRSNEPYFKLIGENYPPETLVFLDESACNRMTGQRNMGWAPIGKRARWHDYFVRGQRCAITSSILLRMLLT